MPERPDHPDHEQLAAFEAGDGDRRERAGVAAHLAGCPSCAEVVASVERLRSRLALLEEPDLPPGLHDRLAAAVDAEATQAAAARPTPWYRRPVAWGAAAALLLAALVVPPSTSQAATSPPPAAAPAPRHGPGSRRRRPGPRVQRPGRGLGGSGQVQAGQRPPGQGGPRLRRPGTPGGRAATGDSPAAPAPQTQAQGGDEAYRSSAPAPQAAATADLQPCLPAAAAAADPATRPLVPAFYLQGTYQGRPATVLVTTSNGQPGRVDLWVFPRDNCSPPPLATERVR